VYLCGFCSCPVLHKSGSRYSTWQIVMWDWRAILNQIRWPKHGEISGEFAYPLESFLSALKKSINICSVAIILLII